MKTKSIVRPNIRIGFGVAAKYALHKLHEEIKFKIKIILENML